MPTLWRNRRLIQSMTRREILARHRGSFGGSLWTFLNPLLLMATYFYVFGIVLQQKFAGDPSREGYVLYFVAGLLPWLPFSEAVGRAPFVILEYRSFVKKLVFPLEILPVVLVVAGLVTEVAALVIYMAGLAAARHSLPATILWLPVLLIPQLLLTAGLAWFLAALGVFFRDLGQVMGFLLTLWYFLTPICYDERALHQGLAANPLYVLVRGYRSIFLEHHPPDWRPLGILWVGSAAIAILGYLWFRRLRRTFADVI